MATANANLDVTLTVAEWASNRPNVLRVFEKYEVDLCRDGDKSVIQACREREIGPQQLVEELTRASQPTHCEIGSDWDHASITELCDHIETVHHRHLRRELPRLSLLLRKVVDSYREAHPELKELQRSFERFSTELEQHLLVEATVVLPAMRSLEADHIPSDSASEYLARLISGLENDHTGIDGELRQIRRLTNGYTLPPNTCATYGAMLDSFWELEWHLHKSIYEESDILFPKAIRHKAALLPR